MFTTHQTNEVQNETVTSEAERFASVQGVDGSLPKTLLKRPGGQPYSEIQLTAMQQEAVGQPSMMEQYQLLSRRTPVGGCERLVEANRKNLLEAVSTALEEQLAYDKGQIQSFLTQLLQVCRSLQGRLQMGLDAQEERYELVDGELAKWQSHQGGQERDWFNMALKFIGFAVNRMTQADAVRLWNERETLHKQLVAYRAAVQLLMHFGEKVEKIRQHLQVVVSQAADVCQEPDAQTNVTLTDFGAFMLDTAVLAEKMSQNSHNSRLLAPLLAAAREGGADKLIAEAEAISAREADAILEGMDIVKLIELEASALADGLELGEIDPVITVAQELLDQVQRRYPTWQLVESARPRSETLQLLPRGMEGFDHPSLTRAVMPNTRDQLGFVHVQMEIALDELRLVRKVGADFERAREAREYFVLEVLAHSARDTTSEVKPFHEVFQPTKAHKTVTAGVMLCD